MAKGYTPTKSTVSLNRPAGKTSATGSNAPTKTQAHVAVAGKNRIDSDPTTPSGARGGHAIGTK